MDIIIRTASPTELEWINARYAQIDFLPSSEKDLIGIAEVKGERAGLGRIVPITDDTGELGGMYVLERFRGRSIAPYIIKYLLTISPVCHLYCIPFAHLERLYRGLGFMPVNDLSSVPSKIYDKYQWCLGHYPQSVLLLEQKLDTDHCG